MLSQPETSTGDSGQATQGWLHQAEAVAPLAEATERVETRCAARLSLAGDVDHGNPSSPHGASAALVNIQPARLRCSAPIGSDSGQP